MRECGALRQDNPGLCQHAGQADQRQANQRGGVDSLHILEQGNAQAFGFEAASTIVGLFLLQVAFYLVASELSEFHYKGDNIHLCLVSFGVKQAQASLECNLFSR